jgi:hypothetical protein
MPCSMGSGGCDARSVRDSANAIHRRRRLLSTVRYCQYDIHMSPADRATPELQTGFLILRSYTVPPRRAKMRTV